MANEIDRILKRQLELQKMADPLGELRRNAELFSASRPDFLQNELRAKLLEDQALVDQILNGLAPGGEIAGLLANVHANRPSLDKTIEQAKRIGLLGVNAPFEDSITGLLKVKRNIGMFRLPEVTEMSRLAHDVARTANLFTRDLIGGEAGLNLAMEKMRAPWVAIDHSGASAKAFSDILAMGRGLEIASPFDAEYALAVRASLGDWRDPLSGPTERYESQIERSSFYLEQGFDPELVSFTPVAFDETLEIAGLRDEGDDEQEAALARAGFAYEQLARFEIAVRRFLERAMSAAFGDDWMRGRLPNNMHEAWIAKRDKAVKAGQAEQPLVDYADFTDYCGIITRGDNWSTLFGPIFGRIEDIRESFQRLYPVRIATMHSRPISLEDELFLRLETRRILKAVSKA